MASKIFNFSLNQDVNMGIYMVSFNIAADGSMPEEFSAAEQKEIDDLFRSAGVAYGEEMENCYGVDTTNPKALGDALVAAGLTAVVQDSDSLLGEFVSVYPNPHRE